MSKKFDYDKEFTIQLNKLDTEIKIDGLEKMYQKKDEVNENINHLDKTYNASPLGMILSLITVTSVIYGTINMPWYITLSVLLILLGLFAFAFCLVSKYNNGKRRILSVELNAIKAKIRELEK